MRSESDMFMVASRKESGMPSKNLTNSSKFVGEGGRSKTCEGRQYRQDSFCICIMSNQF